MNQEMEHSLWFGIGVLGNATSLLLYAAPVLTFSRVIRKRSTEEFSCVPYIIALLNCLIYTWYGLPIVSKEWENFPVVTINGLGVVLEFTFILIYILFTSNKNKADETGRDLGGGSIGVQCDCRCLHVHAPRPPSSKDVRREHRAGSIRGNVRLASCSNEASDNDKECRIHAILPVPILIPGQFPVDGLWTFGPRSHPGVAKPGRKPAGAAAAPAVLQV
ncbi:hypothetical protein MLD38_030424 [Melastoma candidum]|uniref:Uncharacterized protein n=1 Tax=Melastoma candidum TaxID=119954 RepID=A0ACB9MMT8_9MYRT|nr:hypothetical protein MLD38_030424 [Melastoma candidum]